MTGRHQRFFANTQNDRYDTQNLTLFLSNLTQPSPIRRGLTRLSVFGRGNIPPPNRRRWPQAGGGFRRGFRRGLVGERGKIE